MSRMKWITDGLQFRSGCGRFTIRRTCSNPKWSGYWSLLDHRTGQEYPCRTEASAKTAARNIKNDPRLTPETTPPAGEK